MRFRRYPQDVYVGLDLSSGRIKLVGVTGGESGPRLVCAADEVIAGDPARFDAAAVGTHVAALLSRLRVRPASVALVLGPGEAVARRLTVVDQEEAQMAAGLSIQLGQVLGSEVTAARVGFSRLGVAAPPGRVAVFAGAARPEAVAAQQRAVSTAGYPQGPVSTAAAGVVNAWRLGRVGRGEGLTLLLHVGHTAALWILLDAGEPVAVDAPLVGLSAMRERAAGRGGVRVPEDAALPPAVLAEWTGRLRQEIARGLQASRRERGDERDSYEIWVSGGGSRVPGFLDALGAATGVPVHAFDPLRELEWIGDPPNVFGPALVPALGVALQAYRESVGETAGLATDLRVAGEARPGSSGRVPLAAVARTVAADRGFRLVAVLAALAVGGAAYLDAALGRREREVVQREGRVAADSATVAAAMAQSQLLERRRSALGGQIEAVRGLDRGRVVWPRLLSGIAATVPPTAWVSGVLSQGDDPATGAAEFRVHGFAATDAVAGAFARGLERSGAASSVRVERTSLVRIGRMPVVQFELAGMAGADPDSASAEGGAR
jgi:Tfp pilus assembly PilM family ATPase